MGGLEDFQRARQLDSEFDENNRELIIQGSNGWKCGGFYAARSAQAPKKGGFYASTTKECIKQDTVICLQLLLLLILLVLLLGQP